VNASGNEHPQPTSPPVAPPTHPGTVIPERSPAPTKINTPLRLFALCIGSVAAMAPWPLLGILLTHPFFDEKTEAFMLFGGLTLFPLMILAIFGSVPEEVLIVVLMLVWLGVALLPGILVRRRLRSWMAIGILFGAQSAFAFAQAVMGALLIIGKSI
jgi:hypothetical protein